MFGVDERDANKTDSQVNWHIGMQLGLCGLFSKHKQALSKSDTTRPGLSVNDHVVYGYENIQLEA